VLGLAEANEHRQALIFEKTYYKLLELTRLAQTMLLERMTLWALLGLRPPDNRQPLLFN